MGYLVFLVQRLCLINLINLNHIDRRFVFHMIGDVELISGSYSSSNSGFETDFTGTVNKGKVTSSKDFHNQTFIESDIGLGLRPVGSTVELKASSSLPPPYGKFIDKQFVYPRNHQFIIGTSKDSIDTQNIGGYIIESEAFNDLSEDAFYAITTTGGSGYTLQYDT